MRSRLFDLYSINILELHQSPEGLILAPNSHMPIVLALHPAIFDIFQCGEALAKAGVLAPVSLLYALVGKWRECVRRIGIRGGPGDQAPGDVVVASERSRRR